MDLCLSDILNGILSYEQSSKVMPKVGRFILIKSQLYSHNITTFSQLLREHRYTIYVLNVSRILAGIHELLKPRGL